MAINKQMAQLLQRLREMERKLDAIAEGVGVILGEEAPEITAADLMTIPGMDRKLADDVIAMLEGDYMPNQARGKMPSLPPGASVPGNPSSPTAPDVKNAGKYAKGMPPGVTVPAPPAPASSGEDTAAEQEPEFIGAETEAEALVDDTDPADEFQQEAPAEAPAQDAPASSGRGRKK